MKKPKNMKLPPIPNASEQMPEMMEFNDDSHISRFNSYESESIPGYSSHDMTASIYSQPSTKTYNDQTTYNGDLDDLTDDDPLTKDMPPDTTDISRILASAQHQQQQQNQSTYSCNNEQNSNLYDDYAEDLWSDIHMEEEVTDISKLANFQEDPFNKNLEEMTKTSTMNTNTRTTTNGTMSKLQKTKTTSAMTKIDTTSMYQNNGQYSDDYFDNCQYDYEYTDNETDYLASGDIIDRKSNLYPNNNNYAAPNNAAVPASHQQMMMMSSTASRMPMTLNNAVTTAESAKQQEPNKTASILGQSKSLLGGLSSMISGGISSGISKLASTAPDAAAAANKQQQQQTPYNTAFNSSAASSAAGNTTITSSIMLPSVPGKFFFKKKINGFFSNLKINVFSKFKKKINGFFQI